MNRFVILYRCNDSVVSVNGGSNARDCLIDNRSVSKADCIKGCFLSLCKAIRASKYRDLIDLHIFHDKLSFDTRISIHRLARFHYIDAKWHDSDNSHGVHQSFVDQLHEASLHPLDAVLLIEDDYLVCKGAIDNLIDLKLANADAEFAVNLLNEGEWREDKRDHHLIVNADVNGIRYRTCCHSTCSFFLSKGEMADMVLGQAFDPSARSPERATVNPRLFNVCGYAPCVHIFHHMQCNVLNYPESEAAKSEFAGLLLRSKEIEHSYRVSERSTKDRYIVVSPRGSFIRSWVRSYIASGNRIPLIICTGPDGDWSNDDYDYCLKAAAYTGGFVHDCSYAWEYSKAKACRGNRRRRGWYTKTAILYDIISQYSPKEWAWIDDDVEVRGDLLDVFDYAGTCSGFILTNFYNHSDDGKHPPLFQAGKVAWNSLTVFHGIANERMKVLAQDFPIEDDELIFGHLYQNDTSWHDGFDDFPKDWQYICSHKWALEKINPNALVVHYTGHSADNCKDMWRDKATSLKTAEFEGRPCGVSQGRAVLCCLTDGHIKPFLYWYAKSGSKIPLYIIKSNEWDTDKLAIAEAAVKSFGGKVLDYGDVWEYIKLAFPTVSHPAWGAKVIWWRKFIMSEYCPATWMWIDSDVRLNSPVERTFEWFEKHPDKFFGAQSRTGHGSGLFKGRDWFNNYNIFRDRSRCLELCNKIIKAQSQRRHFDDENNLRHVLVTLHNDKLLSGVQCMDFDISYDEPLFPGFYERDHSTVDVVHFGGGRAHGDFKRSYDEIEKRDKIDIFRVLT